MMGILKIIGAVIQCVIPVLAYLGKRKAVKDLHTVAEGVERFSKVEGAEAKGKALKEFIQDAAELSGVEKRLNKRIKKWETTLWKKIF